jgi:hypothetical protein
MGGGVGLPCFLAIIFGFISHQYEIDAQSNEHQMKVRF